MKAAVSFAVVATLWAFLTQVAIAQSQNSYLGFDRNDYPGDANLGVLHQAFAFTGYWLNNPPGAKTNTWT